MNDDVDPFELLRAGDPAPLSAVDGPDSERGRRILATAMANVVVVDQSRRRRWVAITVALVALVATAAAWYLSSSPASNPDGVVCYDAPDRTANSVVVPITGESTVEMCVGLWRDGILPINGPSTGAVPTLVGCVLDGETLLVFPSENRALCRELDLLAHQPTETDPVTDLRAALVESLNPATCVPMNEAELIVVAHFEALGLEGWSVVVQPEQVDRPCSSFGIDGPAEAVVLVPVPR